MNQDLSQRLFERAQQSFPDDYIGLKGRLLRNLNGSLFEILGSFGFSRLVPRKDAA